MTTAIDRNDAAIRRILVPLDGSDVSQAAVAYARQFSGATLVLLQVGTDLTSIFPELSSSEVDIVASDIRRNLEDVAGPLRDQGIAVDTIVELGDPADRIVSVARKQNADLIVMTTHGRGAAGRMLFGSVADRVSRSTEVPTLIVRSRQDNETGTVAPSRVVVTLDGSARAEAAIPVAARISANLVLPVVLIRVVTLEESLQGASRIQGNQRGRAVDTTDETFAIAREATAHQSQDYLDHLAASLVGSVSTLVLHGSPAAALLQELRPSDLAIVTSHGTSGVTRWLLGSVAEKLVREAASPIVLVPTRS
ncbi:MAG: universal stress protein [Thermomicrobiales bacterium]